MIALAGCIGSFTPPASNAAAGSSNDVAPASSGEGPSSGLDAEEQAFLALINAYRAANGAPSLSISPGLQEAARWKSKSMAAEQTLSHSDPNGRSFGDRLKQYYPYGNIAENIAMGFATGQATFEQWKDSPGHDRNMRDADYTVIGIARASDGATSYGWWWTTDFGDKREPEK